jgi:hypothetical protein
MNPHSTTTPSTPWHRSVWRSRFWKKNQASAVLALACSLAVLSPQPAAAALPALQVKPWWGFFAVFANKNYDYKMAASDGVITLTPLGDGAPMLGHAQIQIRNGVLETYPDGKTVFHTLRPDTLETKDPATDKLGKVTLRGKTVGDVVVEVTVEQSRGIILMGARALEKGHLAHPSTAAMEVSFAAVHLAPAGASHGGQLTKRDARKAERAKEKEAKERMKINGISLRGIDGTKQVIGFEESVNASSAEINGKGIAAAEIKTTSFGKNKVMLTASPESALRMSNPQKAPLSKGYTFTWVAAPDKNKEGKARMAIEVK